MTLPIPTQHNDAYLQALPSPANDPRLPSPIFGRGKSTKKFEFAANVLLTTVAINMKNVQEWMIPNSGATIHFLVSAAPMSNIQPVKTPLNVELPYEAHIRSAATCTLALTGLREKSKRSAHHPGPLPPFTTVGCDLMQ